MRKRRVFIAINLPEKIRKKLAVFSREWSELPLRPVRKENLHITLFFLGYIGEEEILEVCQRSREALEHCQPFEIALEQICFGPSGRDASCSDGERPGKIPRLVWVEGKNNPQLGQVQEKLAKHLFHSDTLQSAAGFNKRAFRPHITLARIRQGQWRQLKDKPMIAKALDLSFFVESIEIMESVLSRQGPRYFVLESIKIGK